MTQQDNSTEFWLRTLGWERISGAWYCQLDSPRVQGLILAPDTNPLEDPPVSWGAFAHISGSTDSLEVQQLIGDTPHPIVAALAAQTSIVSMLLDQESLLAQEEESWNDEDPPF